MGKRSGPIPSQVRLEASFFPTFPLLNRCFVFMYTAKLFQLVFSISCVCPLILVSLPFEVARCVGGFKNCNPHGKVKPFPGRSLQKSQRWGELDWLLQPEESNIDCQWQVGACQEEKVRSKVRVAVLPMQSEKRTGWQGTGIEKYWDAWHFWEASAWIGWKVWISERKEGPLGGTANDTGAF